MPTTDEKLALMTCPPSLESAEYQPWSGGRGADVWKMIVAAMSGDVEKIQHLLSLDPGLLE